MANAYVRMRHPDYDALRGMLDDGGAHAARLRLVRVILLGPQRRPTVDAVVRPLDLADGPFGHGHGGLAGAGERTTAS